MIETLKRYALAFIILGVVVLMMLAGTLGVKMFGDKMFENTSVKITPTQKETP